MNLFCKSKTLRKSCLIPLLIFAGATPSLAFIATVAHANPSRSAFSRQSIERLMQDYYQHLTDEGEALHDVDRQEYALDIFDEILLLPTVQFNDVINHMMADYRHHPEHRAAIERLVNSASVVHSTDAGADAVRRLYREELVADPIPEFAKTVLDDALLAFTIAYNFQFGRGIWNGARGVRSTGLTKFRDVTRYVSYVMQRGTKVRYAAFLTGTAAGLAQATLHVFETHRLDPRILLAVVQCGDTRPFGKDTPESRSVVRTSAVEVVAMRDEIRRMALETDEQVLEHSETYRTRIAEMDESVTRITREMLHMYDAAPQCRSQMDPNSPSAPIVMDLTEIRAKVAELGRRLSGSRLP